MKLTLGRQSRPQSTIRGIDWRTLRQPDEGLALVIAIPIGASLATAVLVLWILATPWINFDVDEWSLLAAFALGTAAHELAHAAAFPWSPDRPWITFECSATRLALHAVHDNELSRGRLLWVQGAPLLVVSLLPLALCAVLGAAPVPVVLVTLLNALISGADVLSMLLVSAQVPPYCMMLARDTDIAWQMRSNRGKALISALRP